MVDKRLWTESEKVNLNKTVEELLENYTKNVTTTFNKKSNGNDRSEDAVRSKLREMKLPSSAVEARNCILGRSTAEPKSP